MFERFSKILGSLKGAVSPRGGAPPPLGAKGVAKEAAGQQAMAGGQQPPESEKPTTAVLPQVPPETCPSQSEYGPVLVDEAQQGARRHTTDARLAAKRAASRKHMRKKRAQEKIEGVPDHIIAKRREQKRLNMQKHRARLKQGKA